MKQKISELALTDKLAIKEQYIHAPSDADFEQEVIALQYGCSISLLQKWRSHGGGPRFKKVGRTILYCKADVIKFFNKKYETTAQYANAS